MYHLGRLGPRDVELEVGIFFPVAEQQWELEEEAIVGIAERCQGLRAGVAVKPPFLGLACSNELLPGLEIVGVGFLLTRRRLAWSNNGGGNSSSSSSSNAQRSRLEASGWTALTTSASSFLISTFSSSEAPK